MAAVTQKKFLDDMVAVCDTHGIPLPSLTMKRYERHGHHSHKTGYKLFKVLWKDIVQLACQYVDGTFQPDVECVPAAHFPPPVETVKVDHSMFGFNLLESLTAAPSEGNPRTCLNPPKVHTFRLNPGDVLFAVPDMHAPFLNRGWLVWVTQTILDARKLGGAIHVVQTGDATDLYSLGNYEKNQSIAPKSEMDAAVLPVRQFWQIMVEAGAHCYQLIGNHDVRSEKYVRKRAPELHGFVPTAKELLTFPKVFTADNERDCLSFETTHDQTLVMHGYLNQSIDHVKKHGGNVIHSHLHRGGLNFFNGFFALDAGFGGNPQDWVFAYTNSILRKEWNLGMGQVDVTMEGKMQPHFLRYFG